MNNIIKAFNTKFLILVVIIWNIPLIRLLGFSFVKLEVLVVTSLTIIEFLLMLIAFMPRFKEIVIKDNNLIPNFSIFLYMSIFVIALFIFTFLKFFILN